MSSKNLSYIITSNGLCQFELDKAIANAIANNAKDYLEPPIKNLGYKGILKTSSEIKKWFNTSRNIKAEFQTTAMLMERAGTGGALFRNLYRDFLNESDNILNVASIQSAHKEFIEIAEKWTELSHIFYRIGSTSDFAFVDLASDLLVDLSKQEKSAMSMLHSLDR